MELTRTTPNWRQMPSNSRSSPTSEPVWAWADRAVTSDRPIFSATIGLPAARAFWATAAKRVRITDRFDEHRDGTHAGVVEQVVGEGGAVEDRPRCRSRSGG